MWRFLLKGAVSGLLIWLLLRHRDLGALARQMLSVGTGDLALAGACFWLLSLPSTVRWTRILAAMGHPLAFIVAFPIVLIGLFFNIVLPSSVGGDAVRMWKLHRAGLPGQVAVISVMIDRLVALAALLLLVVASLPELYQLVADRAARNGVLILLAFGFAGFAVALLLDRLPQSLSRYRLIQWVAQLSADLRRVLLNPRYAVPVLFYSLINQGGLIVVTWILARGLGLPVGWSECLLVVPFAVLISVIPISIAGWGLREGAFVAGFGLVGLPATDALALSVLYGLLNTAISLPGGLVWLFSADRKLGAHAARES
jgi:glycosyltransferase 2 family protein